MKYKLFISLGFVFLALGLFSSLYVSYLASPSTRTTLHISLPDHNINGSLLGHNIAEKVYYNISITGDRHVNLNISFYNDRDILIGGLYLEDASRNSSGWIILPESPYRVQAESTCATCRSRLDISLYYARFDRNVTDVLTLFGMFTSILGMSLLTGGLYEYLAKKKLEQKQNTQENTTEPGYTY
jgi:hypothetical protein